MLGTNALSLHWTDTLLHSGYRRANVYNAVEAGSLATILAAALCYLQEVMGYRQEVMGYRQEVMVVMRR